MDKSACAISAWGNAVEQMGVLNHERAGRQLDAVGGRGNQPVRTRAAFDRHGCIRTRCQRIQNDGVSRVAGLDDQRRLGTREGDGGKAVAVRGAVGGKKNPWLQRFEVDLAPSRRCPLSRLSFLLLKKDVRLY